MIKLTKENVTKAVCNTMVNIGKSSDCYHAFLQDDIGHDIVNSSDYSLYVTEENGILVVKDVYPGRIYARLKVDIECEY